MIYAPALPSPSQPSFSVPSISRLRNTRAWAPYQEGLRRIQDPEKAKRRFNKALGFAVKTSRKDAAFLANDMCVKLAKRGRYDEALFYIRRALELAPNLPGLYNNLGIILKELGKYDEAEIEYKKALELNPNYSDVHNNLGNLLLEIKRYDEAENEYKKAIELNPNEPRAYFNFGNLLRERKRYREAEQKYREALELDSSNSWIRNNLGLVLYELERYEDSEREYRNTVELAPESPYGHINLGVLLSITNRSEEAERELKEALRLFKENEPERLEEALDYLESVLEEHSDSYPLWRVKGEFLKTLGRDAEAKKSVERAEFYEAVRYYEDHKEELLRKHEGKFVAILNNRVIDSDEDFEAIGERIVKKFGSRDLLVKKVTKEPEVISIPTPFLVQ